MRHFNLVVQDHMEQNYRSHPESSRALRSDRREHPLLTNTCFSQQRQDLREACLYHRKNHQSMTAFTGQTFDAPLNRVHTLQRRENCLASFFQKLFVILKDMHELDLKRRLTQFIENLQENRSAYGNFLIKTAKSRSYST